MFDALSDKLNLIFKRLKGAGRLSEREISEGLKHVRIALLEADVNYRIAKRFTADIGRRALNEEVISSLTPGQQIIKIVKEEMGQLMGGTSQDLNFEGLSPTSIMLVGLQGSGKTTTTGKLANYLKRKGKTPYLASIDIYRPAAIEQLRILADQLDVASFETETWMSPVNISKNARVEAAKLGCDVLLLDTAGRLGIDEGLMQELVDIKLSLCPSDILLVADAMTGQDAVNVAKAFDDALDLGGIILSKMDGDARGGAALSMKSFTGKPIKFIGVGEKLGEFEVFHPDRMASRILGMGDILTVIDKAQLTLDKKKAIELDNKLKKNRFSLEDFREQIAQVKQMGSLNDLLDMIPGVGKRIRRIKNLDVNDNEFTRIEAIIGSMTFKERENYSIINGSRRKRIAKGSGTRVQDVNRLLKSYTQMLKLMKKMSKEGMRGFGRGMLPF